MWRFKTHSDRYRRTSRGPWDNVRHPVLLTYARSGEQRKKVRLRVATILLAGVALLGVAWGLVRSASWLADALWRKNERFFLEHLIVRSNGRLRAEQVRQYCGIEEGSNLFQINLRSLYETLMSLPVVASVSLQRKPPDTLIIDIRERTALARMRFERNGPVFAVDEQGRVLGVAAGASPLPMITGYTIEGIRPGMQVTNEHVLAALALVSAGRQPQYQRLMEIVRVDVSSPYAMDVRLAQGEQLLMPYAGWQKKLSDAYEIIKRAADMGQAIAAADMTVDRNYPVKFR